MAFGFASCYSVLAVTRVFMSIIRTVQVGVSSHLFQRIAWALHLRRGPEDLVKEKKEQEDGYRGQHSHWLRDRHCNRGASDIEATSGVRAVEDRG